MSENSIFLEIIELLKKNSIKLVAIDFDQTIVSVHTRGAWKGPVEPLVKAICPFLCQLINYCLDEHSFFVAIVTFSTQYDIIKEVMKKVLKNYSNLIIQVNSSEINKKKKGKEGHFDVVLSKIYEKYAIKIMPNEIFLIDDDKINIEIAEKNRHQIFHFTPQSTLASIKDKLRLAFEAKNGLLQMKGVNNNGRLLNLNSFLKVSNIPIIESESDSVLHLLGNKKSSNTKKYDINFSMTSKSRQDHYSVPSNINSFVPFYPPSSSYVSLYPSLSSPDQTSATFYIKKTHK